jgi:hypothetical protein
LFLEKETLTDITLDLKKIKTAYKIKTNLRVDGKNKLPITALH